LKKNSFSFLLMEIKSRIKNISRNNTIESSAKNISFHYDIGNDLYNKMLGKHMQYTCAYFNKPNMTLDEAQYAKMELIAKKLDLKPGMKVLDIGCGFGSMANHLANKYKVHVVGVTLSKEQKIYADKNFSNKNVNILVQDYRLVEGKFDRVYSVGMFEHVGRKNYKEYYDKCYDLLKDDGIMLIHSISTTQRKWNHNTFVGKYIFPEFELPHLKDLVGKFSDKWNIEDLQNFGLSYAKTLRAWNKNIDDWSGLEKYDTKFRRMWKMYLLGCASTFQNRKTGLWQIIYTKDNTTREDGYNLACKVCCF
jgi:cyclopropane-fatty-acyl-phospholipid synthase